MYPGDDVKYNMRVTHISSLFLAISLLLLSGWCEISYGDDSPHTGPEFLINNYRKIEKDPEMNCSAIPFYPESSVSNNASHVDICGTIEYPFNVVKNELQSPANWCDILLLHTNVRACTYKKMNDTWLLTIYNVNKSSDPLKDADQLEFEYHPSVQQPGYFDFALAARVGPFSSKDIRFGLEAIPLDKGRTFIHLRYSISYSSLGYFVMKSYFSIFDHGRVGFSIIGADSEGNPVYVSGLRSKIERDVVLHYLSIPAYMNTLNVPAKQRFDKRIRQWYDLTSQYKRQFFEIEKEGYLFSKKQDRESQLILQGILGAEVSIKGNHN